mmetsp:Transcript_20309/g.39826  ORF Transcript_20309/g.39826 Transcript_20309/m.39826 type:complete len:416 (+) Transcript_20309:2584-3831(+)
MSCITSSGNRLYGTVLKVRVVLSNEHLKICTCHANQSTKEEGEPCRRGSSCVEEKSCRNEESYNCAAHRNNVTPLQNSNGVLEVTRRCDDSISLIRDRENSKRTNDEIKGVNKEREEDKSTCLCSGHVTLHREGATKYHGTDDLCRNTFKEISSTSRAVTHVVTNKICNDSRVSRVILWNALLNLAHEVSTNVSSLGEDSTSELREDSYKRSSKPKANQKHRESCKRDCSRLAVNTLVHRSDDDEEQRNAQDHQQNHNKGRHSARPQRELNGAVVGPHGSSRDANVCSHGGPKSNVSRTRRAGCAQEERHCCKHGQEALVKRLLTVRRTAERIDSEENKTHRESELENGTVDASKETIGALANCGGNAAHLRWALVLEQDPVHERPDDNDGAQANDENTAHDEALEEGHENESKP